MRHHYSGQFLQVEVELASKPSVTLSDLEIDDALYQGQRQVVLIAAFGGASRLRISSRWPMSSTGLAIISAAGFQFTQKVEETSILCRMGYCFAATYTIYLICMVSRLIRMYVSLIFSAKIGLIIIIG
jgi:hypothetical protein